MNPEMFCSLLDMIGFLGSKDNRSKEETLTYNSFLIYASGVARYNERKINEEIRHLDDDEVDDVKSKEYSTKI